MLGSIILFIICLILLNYDLNKTKIKKDREDDQDNQR